MRAEYNERLFRELDRPRSLRTPLAMVWKATASRDVWLRPGKLTINEEGILPGAEKPATDSDTLAAERAFAEGLPTAAARETTLFQLARAYGSRTATSDRDFVSQFDANRLAVAQAACDARGADGRYLFVKGGISGIQNYLYGGVKAEQPGKGEAEQVAKLLRGRSALVGLLGQLIAECLVSDPKIDLGPANVLFVGGGHFNLLLAAGQEEQLEEAIWAVNQSLYTGGDLQLHLVRGVVELSAAELQDFGPVFQRANVAMDANKQRRYAKQLTGEVIFQHRMKTEEENSLAEREKQIQRTKRRKERIANFGSALVTATHLIEIRGEERRAVADALGYAFGRRLDIPAVATTLVPLRELKWKDFTQRISDVDLTDIAVTVYRLNDTNFLPTADQRARLATLPIGYGFRLLNVYAPTDANGKLWELKDLAQLDSDAQSEGLPYPILASVRLDVDDLGALFLGGFGSKTSLTQILSLSREFSLFFGGYFHQLAKKHHIYVIYAGGDDAFVLGSWLNAIHFVAELREKFGRFVAGNLEVTFSAGIFQSNPSYPIARLYQDAAEREDRAKDVRKGNTKGYYKKDGVSVFDHDLPGERFVELLDFAQQLTLAVTPGGEREEKHPGRLRRSILQTLLRVITVAEQKGNAADPAAAEFEYYRQLGRLHGLTSRRGVDDHGLVQQMLSRNTDYASFRDYLFPLNYALQISRVSPQRSAPSALNPAPASSPK